MPIANDARDPNDRSRRSRRHEEYECSWYEDPTCWMTTDPAEGADEHDDDAACCCDC